VIRRTKPLRIREIDRLGRDGANLDTGSALGASFGADHRSRHDEAPQEPAGATRRAARRARAPIDVEVLGSERLDRIAKELDPLSPSAFHLVAYSLMGKREYDRAAAEFHAALDLNPNWTWGYIKLAKTYADNGQCEEAFATAEDAEAELHGGGTPLARSWMGYTYGKCGDTDRAEAALRALDEFAENTDVDPFAYGIIYAALGDKDGLLDEVERSVDDHSTLAAFMPGLPTYYMPGLEDDPRFQNLMDRIGFTESGVHGGNTG